MDGFSKTTWGDIDGTTKRKIIRTCQGMVRNKRHINQTTIRIPTMECVSVRVSNQRPTKKRIEEGIGG
jgi:hypothetical protein